MRSEPLTPTDKLRILGFGDSVLNGGVLTEQDSLATSIIEKKLKEEYRCLNISAGSWGPDNCFAWLSEYGNFNAGLFFLIVSSHDAHDNMDFRKTVGIDVSHPFQQYKSAIYELMDRYLIPRILRKKTETGDNIAKGDTFNQGFSSFFDYTQNNNIPFFIYLHPEMKEIEEGKYNEQGEQIIQFCKEHHICLIKGLAHEDISCFRDNIHLNEHGQHVLANALLPVINSFLNE